MDSDAPTGCSSNRIAQNVGRGNAWSLILASLTKRGRLGINRAAWEIGRLLGKNSRAAKLFEITVGTTDEGAARINWKKSEPHRNWATLSAGCYLLRSNVTDWSDEDLWKAYIQLTEAEAAFCIQKSDLKIRPIWHQKEERVRAHILVCFLAIILVATLKRCRAGTTNVCLTTKRQRLTKKYLSQNSLTTDDKDFTNKYNSIQPAFQQDYYLFVPLPLCAFVSSC